MANGKVIGTNAKIADLIVSEVGQIGENIQLRRGMFWPKQSSSSNSAVKFMIHPVSTIPAVVDTDLGPLNVGKYAAIVEAKRDNVKVSVDEGEEPIELTPIEEVCQHIAQQVIGMNPNKIIPEKKEENADQHVDDCSTKEKDIDDRALVNQSFVLDEDITVGEYLKEQHVQVIDFARFEVGETDLPKN